MCICMQFTNCYVVHAYSTACGVIWLTAGQPDGSPGLGILLSWWVGSCGSCATLHEYTVAGAQVTEVTLYAQASQALQIMTETDVVLDPKSPEAPPWSPRCPKWFHRHPKGAKGMPE